MKKLSTLYDRCPQCQCLLLSEPWGGANKVTCQDKDCNWTTYTDHKGMPIPSSQVKTLMKQWHGITQEDKTIK